MRHRFPKPSLTRFKESAQRCLHFIESNSQVPAHYRFIRSAHCVLLTALLDFGFTDESELQAPLSAPGLADLFSQAMGPAWTCRINQSWLRKKFAPHLAPAPAYHIQDWHQDGALGVTFPPQPGPDIPMTALLTCWIPLDASGIHSPGLEFIRGPQPSLLHFTHLDDASLRRRFPQHDFWAPALEFGDGLVFLNSVLHRTHARPEMQHNRLSVEYRIFPA